MSDKAWKAYERRIAKEHHTARIPVLGRKGPDFENDTVCGQVKLRKHRPANLTHWLDDVNEDAHRKGKVGVVFWRTPGEDHDQAVVILRYADYLRLCGQAATRLDG